MVVPWTVNSRLNTSGDSTFPFGKASCARMSAARVPASAKKNSAVAMYMIPSRLWSTVTIHSCSLEGTGSASVL